MREQFDKDKLKKTFEIFDEYEKRFSRARTEKVLRNPWEEKDREEIRRVVKDVLKFDEKFIPEIKVLEEDIQMCQGIEVRHMLFESWKHFYGISSLYVPEGAGKRPLVILCPGHGEKGRLTKNYQRMAITLAKQGAYVLAVENIGQGCREKFGHRFVPEAFYCGLTLQGLIVMETCAWVRYMKEQPFIDVEKIGACGNSGGGTLTEFLSAMEPTLAAVASTGYPSEFAYVLQKERRHCDCNLLSHFAGRLEMWEVYSLFAPKPLFLECGQYDDLLPVDLFHKNARKVEIVYQMLGKPENFYSEITNTKHSWDEEDVNVICNFFMDVFRLKMAEVAGSEHLLSHEDVHLEFPKDAVTTGRMVEELTGITMPPGMVQSEIIRPKYRGQELDSSTIISDLGRGDLMRVFSQYEFSLEGNGGERHGN